MAYNRISGKPTKGTTKEIDKPLGGFMPTGPHDTRIDSIENKIRFATFRFVNSFGEIHRQNLFFLTPDGNDISFQLKELLAATCDPDDILELSKEILEHEDTRLVALLNRDVHINLTRPDGYSVRVSREGVEAVYRGTIITTAPDVSLLKMPPEFEHLKRSFINVKSYQRKGERRERSQSFLTDGATPVKTTETSRTGNMEKGRLGQIPANRKFF